MADGHKITVDAARKALASTRGNLNKAAALLKVTRRSLELFIERNPELVEVRREAREVSLDVVEDKLWTSAESGEPWAVTFVLKTQGKARGYTERQEITGKDGAALDVTHALKGAEDLPLEQAVILYQKIMTGGGGKS